MCMCAQRNQHLRKRLSTPPADTHVHVSTKQPGCLLVVVAHNKCLQHTCSHYLAGGDILENPQGSHRPNDMQPIPHGQYTRCQASHVPVQLTGIATATREEPTHLRLRHTTKVHRQCCYPNNSPYCLGSIRPTASLTALSKLSARSP
jgi:hypothetical protein